MRSRPRKAPAIWRLTGGNSRRAWAVVRAVGFLFYNGITGIAFSLTETWKATGDAEYRDAAVAVNDFIVKSARSSGSGATWTENASFGSGDTGAILYLLYAGAVLHDDLYLKLAARGGAYVLTRSQQDPLGGLRWKGAPGGSRGASGDTYFPNFEQGTAGVAYGLARLYIVTKDARFLDAARQGGLHLQKIATVQGNSALIYYREPDKKDLLLGFFDGSEGRDVRRPFSRSYGLPVSGVFRRITDRTWALYACCCCHRIGEDGVCLFIRHRTVARHLCCSASFFCIRPRSGPKTRTNSQDSREAASPFERQRCQNVILQIHLIDGTYELFRHYYALPSARDRDGCEVAAVRGVLASVLGMIRDGATHIAVATDHVIESFRNSLWPGYKTGAGIEPDLLAQFPLLEDVLSAAGVTVWPMVEFEADDALAAAAAAAAQDARVEQVVICTPDKDLAQCVRGSRIVQLNRRTRIVLDEAGVVRKFGVPPGSIPDYLALVGDAADGYPGLPGWGAKSTAAVLARFGHLEAIPSDWRDWHVNVSGAGALAHTLAEERGRAMLFRTLATLRTDIALFDDAEQLRWNGPTPAFTAFGTRFDAAVTRK